MNNKITQYISEVLMSAYNISVSSITEQDIDGIDGYLCYVNILELKSTATVFVIKNEYIEWLRNEKINSILE